MRSTIDEQINQLKSLLKEPPPPRASKSASTKWVIGQVLLLNRTLVAEVARLRKAFDDMAGQRDHWMQLHERRARQVATYSAGVPHLLGALDLVLRLEVFGEDSYGRSLLLALRRGLEELHQVNNPPRDTCAMAPSSTSLGPT